MPSNATKKRLKLLPLLEHLYAALKAEHGVVIRVDDIRLTRAKLYKLRIEHAPEFDNLSFIVSSDNPETELWILKNG